MWRSPEAQAGTRIGKASDMFSFGMVVSAPCKLREPACEDQLRLNAGLQYFKAMLRTYIFSFEKEQLEEGVSPEEELWKRITVKPL